MKTALCFLILFSLPVFAEEKAEVKSDDNTLEVRKSNYQINTRYKAGAFLIYDCRGEYYACVDKDGSEACKAKRDDSIAKKETFYPCAPLNKFDDKKTCLLKNYEVLESRAKKRFCYPK